MINKRQKEIRANITNERKRRNWGYAKLAQFVVEQGVAMMRNVPYEIEHGRHHVTSDELVAFSKIFNKPIDWFFQDPEQLFHVDSIQRVELARALFENFSTKHEEWDEAAWTEMADELIPLIEGFVDTHLKMQKAHHPIAS